MADKKEKWKYALKRDEVMALVDPAVSKSNTFMDTQISSERSRIQRYYDGDLPERQSKGNSSYVSSDVYDSVESMKAQLLEVFAGGHNIIRFKGFRDEDVLVSRIETGYVDHIVFDKNSGFEVFSDVIDDALKGRNGIVQVYWEDCEERDEHSFEGMPREDVEALAAQDDVLIEADMDEGSLEGQETYSGKWTRVIDNSRIVIENVPPEEYFSDGSKKNREDGVRGRKSLKTRGEMIKDGFDKETVMEIGADSELSLSTEKATRDQETWDTGTTDQPAQPELEQIMVYETYISLALNGDGRTALYRIIHAGNKLFEIDEVEEDNFITFTPLRRPHSQFGNNFGKRVVPTQNARTVLTRSILDHTATTTNPRWQVLNGAVANPRELLDNRLRGIVNVKMRDGIAPLQYPNMNPFVFQTLEMLKGNKEENTGMSSLSQGLNKDAISSQNSQGLVDNLVTLSQVRQKIIARNFAAFLSKLYLKVRKLVIENEKRQRVFEFDSEFASVDPKTWTPTREVQVSLHIGYGEQEKEAAKYAQLWGLLTQDPAAKLFCPPPQQHKLLVDGMKKNGFANAADYIIQPDQVKPPGPDPIEMKKLEIEDKKAEAALLTAKTAQAKVEGHQEIEHIKTQIAALLASVKQMTAERDADRKDIDVANKVNVSQRELELAETVDPVNQKAIFSANS